MTSTRTTLDHLGITEWHLRHSDSPAPLEQPTLTSAEQMANLRHQVKSCQNCQLGQTRKQALFGTGNLQAKLMLIGEQPDAHTDATGHFFSGPVGELLTKMLAAIEQTPESIYLTTLVKCHPNANREPFSNEITECVPYLQQQIALVQPTVIMTLGPLAAMHIMHSTASLAALRNQNFAFGDKRIPVVASYAPAYLLHNPGDKRAAFQDLLRVAALLKEA